MAALRVRAVRAARAMTIVLSCRAGLGSGPNPLTICLLLRISGSTVQSVRLVLLSHSVDRRERRRHGIGVNAPEHADRDPGHGDQADDGANEQEELTVRRRKQIPKAVDRAHARRVILLLTAFASPNRFAVVALGRFALTNEARLVLLATAQSRSLGT